MISPDHFRAILDCMGDSVLVKDEQHRFVFVNNSACKMFGLPPERWLGNTEYDIFRKEEADLLRSQDEYVLETEDKDISEGQITDAHGNTRVVVLTKTLYDNKTGPKYIVCTVRDITERKGEVLETVRRAKEKYRLLADNAADVIFIFGLDWKFKYISPSVEKLRGFTPEEMIGQSIGQSITPESLESVKKVMQEELELDRTGRADPDRARVLELEMWRKDGSTVWTEVKTSALRSENGTPTGIMGISRDITERKRAEEALRAKELQLSQAMDLAHIVYWEVDPADGMLLFNDPFYAFYGTAAEQEGGYRMTWEEYTRRFVYPEDQARISQIVEQNIARPASESLADVEHRIVRRDGEVRHIVVRATVAKDDAGRLVRRYGINQDITEHKRAEEELLSANQRLLDIVEFLPDATFVIDSNKKVLAWNHACEEMTGVKKEDVVGKGDYVYAVPFYGERRPILIDYVTTDRDEIHERYVSVKKKGNVLHAEVFVQRLNNGKGAYVSGVVSPLFDRAGKLVGAIESIRDITEFKRLETQLHQAQKMEAMGTLAGGIAHDFNNILTALMGYGELLKTAIKTGALRNYVEQILSASQKAADLVKSLLAFSRQQAITLKPVSIQNIVRGTEKLLKRLLTEDIVVITRLAAEDIIVMADPTQIDQILFNLATNARDAMPHGGTFAIETRVVDLDDEFERLHGYGKAGRYALLSVSDTGVGMDEAMRGRIFDPFFTTKEGGKGTGLGLSTVYGIVKQHSGYVTVYSEPNMGTTFHIYLPTAREIAKEETSEPAPIKGGNELILIGEDNEAVRELIDRILARHGYRTIRAVDGQHAVELFAKTGRVDLLLLDSVMPKKNGWEAYNEIRAIKPDIKVIFMSGHTRDVVLDKGVEDGKYNFLHKPVSPVALLQKVREVLDNG